MTRNAKTIMIVIGALVLAFVGYFTIGRPIQVLPRVKTALPFEMTDQHRDTYRYPDNAGPMNVYVVAAAWDEEAVERAEQVLELVYTHVRDEDIEEVVNVAWITPDPGNDDIESFHSLLHRLPVIQKTAASLLSAAPLATRLAVGAGLGIYVGPVPEDGTRVSYEATLALVDDVGYVRGRYALRDLNEQVLLRDVSLLAAEVQAEGSERALYQAAHLFLCYPR